MRKIITVALSVVLCLLSTFTIAGCAKPSEFNVVFETNGGYRVSGGALVQTVTDSEQLNPPVLEKEGYTFIGWDKSLSNIESDATVTAVWEKNSFTVTFSVSNGVYVDGSGATIQTVRSGGELILPVYTRTGYSLTWDKEVSEITETCTVNGVWTPNEYKLSFLNSDGSAIDGVEDMTIFYDEKISALPVLENGKQKFVGWKAADGRNFSVGQIWKYDEDVTVNAVWTDYEKHVINVDLNGGNQMILPTTYTEGTGAIINAASRDGYVFTGWVELDKNGNVISEPQTIAYIGNNATGDKYYRATWQVKSYTVDFTTISGKVSMETMTFTYGQTITELPSVTDNDGTFLKWEYDGKEIKVGDKWTIDESGIEVKAVFIRKFVFVLRSTGYSSGGVTVVGGTLASGVSDTIELCEGERIILPGAVPNDTNEYKFSCWKYKNDNGAWVKLASNTLVNASSTFPNNDFGEAITVNVELVAFYASMWTGYY